MENNQVCSVCHGKGFTVDSGKNKIDCGACEWNRKMEKLVYGK